MLRNPGSAINSMYIAPSLLVPMPVFQLQCMPLLWYFVYSDLTINHKLLNLYVVQSNRQNVSWEGLSNASIVA